MISHTIHFINSSFVLCQTWDFDSWLPKCLLSFTKPDSKNPISMVFFPHFKNNLRWTDNQKISFETILFSLIQFHKLTVHCTLSNTAQCMLIKLLSKSDGLQSLRIYPCKCNTMLISCKCHRDRGFKLFPATCNSIGPKNCYAFIFNSSYPKF